MTVLLYGLLLLSLLHKYCTGQLSPYVFELLACSVYTWPAPLNDANSVCIATITAWESDIGSKEDVLCGECEEC